MRNVPDSLLNAWESNTFVGNQRYAVRATIQKIKIALTQTGEWVYSSALFPQVHRPRELPNIRKLSWDRDTQAPTQSSTLEMYNYKRLPIGQKPPAGATNRIGQPGYYTPRRGLSAEAVDLWAQTSNEWRDWLVYDRVIRTYEGYGFNPGVAPEDDPNLVLTGVWLTSDIDFNANGLITVTMKDLGRQLTDDNLLFPPVVPVRKFPIQFSPYGHVPGPDITDVSASFWSLPAYSSDSGIPYNGPNGNEWGHHPIDAFDDSHGTYWLSVGNESPDADYAYEYIEGKPWSSLCLGVHARVWGGPYRCYLSIHSTTKGWLGRGKIPYNPNDRISAPNGANIPFVDHKQVEHEGEVLFRSPVDGWTDVDKVRLTFHHLYNSGIGPYPYRAGVRIFTTSGEAITVEHTTKTVGYKEYTDIIKVLCAMGGFFWPSAANKARIAESNGSILDVTTSHADPVLGGHGSSRGRVWGDLQNTGTGPITSITPDQLDKQPIYTAIQIIQETIGFLFYIDETGGVVWRMPNYFKLGNWVLGSGPTDSEFTSRALSPVSGEPVGSYTPIPTDARGRSSHFVTIDDKQRITNLTAKLSGANVREKIFVGNLDGTNGDFSKDPTDGPKKTGGSGSESVAAVTNGVNPYPSGFRRVAGWLDQHFESKQECQRMADLIALAQAMTIWTDTITIAGNPQIQIDDQVLVQEETSADASYHYVSAIHSDGDMEGGKWTYQLTTNELGVDPGDPTKWIFDPKRFSSVTTTYLKGLKLL